VQRVRLFPRAWHFIGHDGLVKDPGQVHPFTLLDDPLLLARDAAGLHAISNVCTHRGTIVVESPYRASHLRCRYHGRKFALDGRFESMPEFEGAANFQRRRPGARRWTVCERGLEPPMSVRRPRIPLPLP